MRIAVVDDERPARSELKYLVEQCEPEAEIAEADGSEEFLAMLENETFDVCFVDINLGGMNLKKHSYLIGQHITLNNLGIYCKYFIPRITIYRSCLGH